VVVGGGIVGAIIGHQFMERARAILPIFWELSSGGVTLCNIWCPYHGTRQDRRWRYILKYLYLAAKLIVDSLSLQNAINLQLFISCKCNQLLIICTDKIELIRNCLRQQKNNQLFVVYICNMQSIVCCLYLQHAINCLLFIVKKCN